jgi:hypothetical protein
VTAIKEPVLQKKVATFTQAYTSARFGNSVEGAKCLPELFREIVDGNGAAESADKPEHVGVR